MAWITATIYTRGGTCSHNTIYYHTSFPPGWYPTQNTEDYRLFYVSASKPGCEFMGGWTGPGGTGTQIIGKSGVLYDPPTSSSALSIYLTWEGCSSATLSLTDLAGGPPSIIYDPVTGNLYDDASMSTPLPETTVQEGGQTLAAWGPITLPAKECYDFRGFWSASNNTLRT